MCRELVAEVLNIFNILCDFFSRQNIGKPIAGLLRDCRTTVIRHHVTVVNLSRQNFGKLRKIFATLLQMLC